MNEPSSIIVCSRVLNGDESLGVLFEFEPVNEKETNLQVKEFFDKDVQKLQDLASETLQGIIKSPSFDGIGSADHSINKSEKHYIRVVDAKNELEIIAKAINDCPALSKKILNLRFVQGLQQWQIMKQLSLSSNKQYQKYRRKAYYDFADQYSRYGRELRVFAEN